jgi:hypothetical protein
MSKTLYRRIKKVKPATNLHIFGYEKTVVLKRLEMSVEKLREAHKEILQVIQVILKMGKDGDIMADQAIAALAEMHPNVCNRWILSDSEKTRMKKEAAKPLLLLRID